MSGQHIKFSNPILEKSELSGAKYLLLEKNIADGRYVIMSISTTRQPIINGRQERIAFSSDLTSFAPDYENTAFRTYTDPGNYGEKTVITTCTDNRPKIQIYSPCNSDFGDTFVPMGITKAYIAGKIGSEAMKEWTEPSRNRLRYVKSPQFAMEKAGVFQRLTEIASTK